MVLNFNACSIAHRDDKDDKICVVFPFGSFIGGELVLYELGLVIKLRPGDILFFDSVNITHFNLKYEGFRGSVVLSTDKAYRSYIIDHGGWIYHIQ